jgi:EmrB/QacA subfamily drug resistance transporter
MSTVSQSSIETSTEAPRYSKRETLLTMCGVLMVMLLASLDQTIVSTAMPRITAEFNGLDRYTWVTTAYLLASTVMIPIYGKLSDIFGRKPIFLVGVVLFLSGSALCGMAWDMNTLIAFRAFQGLGAAALMPIALAVIGDLFTPRERGKWQGVTGAVFGLSSVLGPLAGGWITDNSSWRWVFYVNLPVGIIALLVLIFLMPSLQSKVTNARIDYLGALLLVVGTVPLMLGFTWAGSQYDWLSPQVLGLFAGSLVFLVLFFVYEINLEKHGKQPIIAPSLFKSGIFDISIAITMITSMAMFGSIFFLPLFAQGVLGISASSSGLLLSPMMISLIVGSTVSGLLISRLGKYKWIAILGMIVSVGGGLLLLRLNVDSGPSDLWTSMIVLGLGMGFGMSLYTVVVQNALPNKIGEATSALTFFRQIGSTIALSAMGSAMSAAYIPAFRGALSPQVKQFAEAMKAVTQKDILATFDNPNILLSPDAKTQMVAQFQKIPNGMQLYDQIMHAVKIGLSQGVHNVFLISIGFMLLGFVLVFFLKEIPLRGRGPQKVSEAAEEGLEEAGEAVNPVMMH